MQDTPNNYLGNYFFVLKREVDLEFSLIEKEEDKEKWLEIIDKIKSIEMHYYDQIKPFTTYNDEIQSIKQEIKESIELNTNESTKQKLNNFKSINFFEKLEKSIDEITFKIEKDIFLNKTFLFMKEIGENEIEKNTFLLIINDEYLRKNILENQLELTETYPRSEIVPLKKSKIIEKQKYFTMTKEKLNCYFLHKKLCKMDLKNINVLSLNLNSSKEDSFITRIQINEIHLNTFNGLSSLKDISIEANQIEEIHPKTFDGLISLESIRFYGNKIKKIHTDTFKGLISLVIIAFNQNQIKEIDQTTFSDLVSLRFFDFTLNKIKELHQDTFKNLKKLTHIRNCGNQIEVIHPNTFVGLIYLENIDFGSFGQ